MTSSQIRPTAMPTDAGRPDAGDGAKGYSVTAIEEDRKTEWDAYVLAHPRGTVYHTFAWRQVFSDVFGHASHYVAAVSASTNAIVGALPLVRVRSRLFGDFMVSMPFVNYGGALGEEDDIEVALMDRAGAIATELGCEHVEFRDLVSRDGRWHSRTDKVIMELDLPDDPEELSRAFGTKLRAQVKRSRRDGAQVVVGGRELIREFYEVFARNMRDLGTPVYARSLFDVIAERFASRVAIAVVRLASRPVAAGFLIRDRDRMEIPWASSLREYNRLGVNMLLYWRALEYAVESGCARFDFGRSSRDSGTFRFKRQWGARPRATYWHYWLPEGASPVRLSPDNPKYALAIGLWMRLPLAIANCIGPRIVRGIP